MNEEDIEKVRQSLLDFICRVSKGGTISDKEIEILPEIVKIVKEI